MSSIALLYENDKEIISEYVASKSPRAANAFVRKHQKFVYATALRYLGNHDDADDIAQEVFIKALDNLHKFRGESNIKTWLYRIAVNLSHNAARKKKFLSFFISKDDSETEIEFNSNSLNPAEELENKEFMENFNKVLKKLPEKQRETFALRYFEDLSYEEISQLIGTSVGGLKANYFQAVQKISTELKRKIK